MNKIIGIMTSAATIAMAAVPLSALPAFAHAQGVTVQVSDLDLSRPADAARFQSRVEHAAWRMCSNSGEPLSQISACSRAIRVEAVEKLGDAQRRDLHRALQTSVQAGWRTASF